MANQLQPVNNVAIVGAGLIGLSWAALFAASGRKVFLHDSVKDPAEAMAAVWSSVKPEMRELGLLRITGEPDIRICSSLQETLSAADFVQECIPERLDAKQALYRQMEANLIGSRSYQDLRRERDAKLVAVLKAIKSVDAGLKLAATQHREMNQ